MSRAWMPFYPADYVADTGHLSTLEHGAYLLLILHYWQKGGLPTDDLKLARIARLTAEEWLEVRPTIAEFFGPDWTHGRVERELATAEERYQKRASAGRRGGRSAVKEPELPLDPEQCESNASALLHQPQPQPQPHSDPRSEDEIPLPRATTPDGGGRGASLEADLREAAGLVGVSARALSRLEPIERLLARGVCLEGTILPALRSVREAGHFGRSWSYYLDAIAEGRKPTNPASSASPASHVSVASVWVRADSSEGRAWQDHLTGKGDDPRWLPSSRHGTGRSMPSRWPPGHPNAASEAA